MYLSVRFDTRRYWTVGLWTMCVCAITVHGFSGKIRAVMIASHSEMDKNRRQRVELFEHKNYKPASYSKNMMNHVL